MPTDDLSPKGPDVPPNAVPTVPATPAKPRKKYPRYGAQKAKEFPRTGIMRIIERGKDGRILKTQRETFYTDIMGAYIGHKIAQGSSLKKLLSGKNGELYRLEERLSFEYEDEAGAIQKQYLPTFDGVSAWLTDPTHPFCPVHDRARIAQLQGWADEMVDIAEGEGDVAGETGTKVRRDHLRIESRKWLLAHGLPRIYGDRITISNTLVTEDYKTALKTALIPTSLSDEEIVETIDRFISALDTNPAADFAMRMFEERKSTTIRDGFARFDERRKLEASNGAAS